MRKDLFFIALLMACIAFLFLTKGVANTDPKGEMSLVPIPLSEAGLPVIMAEPWLQISAIPNAVPEAPAFDRDGNLFVTSVFEGRVFRITPGKKVSVIFDNKSFLPTGCAIHKDGRLFVVCASGQILIMNPDGGNVTEVKTRHEGNPRAPDDLVFDFEGNFYVTDLGDSKAGLSPTGGVYRYSEDLKTVDPIVRNLVSPNGISLAPPGISMPSVMPARFELWVAEPIMNRLLHLRLKEDGITPASPPVNVAYYFQGDIGPDSNKVDSEGNVYQCIFGQGRIVILNKAGIPVSQVLMPGRDEGRNLFSTNLAFKPGTAEGYITVGSTDGAWIYKFGGLAKGLELFSHK